MTPRPSRPADETRARPDGGRDTESPTALGLAFGEGVVLAATAGRVRGSTVAGSDQPVAPVHPTAAVTLTAGLGDAQAFARRLRAEADRYERKHGAPMSVDALATRAGDLLREESPADGRLLLGGTDDDGAHLYVLGDDGGVTEDDLAAVGSGAQVAIGALEAAAEPDLDRERAVDVAADALRSACERDPGSTGGLFLAEITDEVDVRELDGSEQ